VLYVCGERLKRLSFDWQTDGIGQEHLNEINRFLNEFANDIINFAKNKWEIFKIEKKTKLILKLFELKSQKGKWR